MFSRLRNKLNALQGEGLSPGSPEGYVFAIACVAIAAITGLSFSFFINDVTFSIPSYAAIFIAALFGGIRAGMVAAVLSASMVWWTDSLYFGGGPSLLIQSINRGLYVSAAILIIWVANQLRHRDKDDQQPSSPALDSNVVVRLPTAHAPPDHFRQKIASLWREGIEPNSRAAYAFALACVAIAALVRFGLGQFGEYILPLVCFYPAVLVVSLVGRLEVALFAIGLSLVVVGWAFVPPYFTVGLPTPDQVIDCELFLFACLLSVWLTERHRYSVVTPGRDLSARLELIGPVIFSLGLVSVTTLVLIAIEPIVGPKFLVLGYLIPTIAIAILYGNAFALLTSFASALAAAYILFPPEFNLYVVDPAQIATLAIFFLIALAMSKIASLLTYGTRGTRADAEGNRRDGSIYYYSSNSERRRTGVLLIHGVGGTPRELKPVADGLAARGYTVSCCQLAGHGGSEEDLLTSRWTNWFASAEQALAELEQQCDVIVVGGLSVGGILALRLAALHPDRIQGLCLFAPTLRYDGWAIPWYSFLLTLGVRAPILRRMRFSDPPPYGIKDEATRAIITDIVYDSGSSESGTQSTSLGMLQESHWLVRDVVRRLPSIKSPALIIHPREDDVSDLSNSIYLQRHLGGLVECWILDDSYHLITIDRQRDVVMNRTADFVTFVERNAAKQRPESARSRPTLVAGREYSSTLRAINPTEGGAN